MDVITYKDILARNNLRQLDVAWMCDVHVRSVRRWGLGQHTIPQAAALLLTAYDQGLITPVWLAAEITKPLP
jgi:hypothetical protein